MQLVVGRVDSINEREAGKTDSKWIERTLVLRNWGSTLYVKVGKNLADQCPNVGDDVAIEVSVNVYQTKDGRLGFELYGQRRNSEFETKLYGSAALKSA